MRLFRIAFFLVVSSLAIAAPILGQDSSGSIAAKAKSLYSQGSYGDAYDFLMKSSPEGSDAKTKTAVSDSLVEIAQAEYSAQNYKNAYEAFRAALKLRPTNQTATQMYLKMRKEMDVANLTNAPAKAAVAQPAAPVAAAPAAVAPAPAVSAPPSAPAAQAQPSELEMKRLMAQLQSAQAQLASSARTSSKGDAQSIQQVLDILSEIVKKQAEPPAPIVIQQDPRFESLLQSLGVQLDRSNRVALDPLFVMVAVAVAFLLLVFTCLILIILVRARRRMARKESLNRETTAKIVQPEGSFALAPAKPALIGYSTSDGMDGARDIDTSLRKGLLRMERLQGMYDELRAGSLRWESVRANIDELGSALKTDILNLVEQKLDAGDLVSYEAVLPVIFPFLTDYDDFFREKADNLARAALVSNARQIEAAIAGPFELRELAQIPERLKLALKGADRSVITAKLSRAVAKRMGLSPSEREGVYKGALAHDVGYLTLDADRLHRVISRREITKEDMEFVKSHAVRGASFFGDASLPEYLREAILSHHERVDGSGYPRALAGEAIPLIARIIGASETFVSLISKRSYRDRFEVGQALAILKDGRGTKFDPAVVDALAAIAVHLEGAL